MRFWDGAAVLPLVVGKHTSNKALGFPSIANNLVFTDVTRVETKIFAI